MNKIRMLKNDNSIWVKDEDSLKIMASLFFLELISKREFSGSR
jgi:hypothetical protein